jgi:hypothetical protein
MLHGLCQEVFMTFLPPALVESIKLWGRYQELYTRGPKLEHHRAGGCASSMLGNPQTLEIIGQRLRPGRYRGGVPAKIDGTVRGFTSPRFPLQAHPRHAARH